MKKVLALILAVMTLLMTATAFAADVKVTVNGEEVVFDREAVIDGEVLLVPYRAIAEKLGAKVSWHQDTKTVFSEYKGSVITMQIDNEAMFVNSETVALVKAPVLTIDRTLVPVQVFEKGMGAKCVWDRASMSLTIEK